MSPPHDTDQGLIAPVVPLRRRATDATRSEPAPPLQTSIATLERADEPVPCLEHPDIWEHPAPCLRAREPPVPPTDARGRQREGAKRSGVVRHLRVAAAMAACAGVVALGAVAVAVSAQHRTGAVATRHVAATHQEARVPTVKARRAESHANGDRPSAKPAMRSRHRQQSELTRRQNPPAPVAAAVSREPETSTASSTAPQIAPATDARSAPTGAITTSQASAPPPPASQPAGSSGGCATAVPGQLGC